MKLITLIHCPVWLLPLVLGLVFHQSALGATVSGNSIKNGYVSSIPLHTGQACFASTCFTVTDGTFTGTIGNGTYTFTVTDATSTTILTIPGVVVPSGGWVFDTYVLGKVASGGSNSASGIGPPTLLCSTDATYSQTNPANPVFANWKCGTPGQQSQWYLAASDPSQQTEAGNRPASVNYVNSLVSSGGCTSNPCSVSQGGTGATSAAQALVNLFAGQSSCTVGTAWSPFSQSCIVTSGATGLTGPVTQDHYGLSSGASGLALGAGALSDDGTTVSSSEPVAVNGPTTGANQKYPNMVASTGACAANQQNLYADPTTNRLEMCNNNDTLAPIVKGPAGMTPGHLKGVATNGIDDVDAGPPSSGGLSNVIMPSAEFTSSITSGVETVAKQTQNPNVVWAGPQNTASSQIVQSASGVCDNCNPALAVMVSNVTAHNLLIVVASNDANPSVPTDTAGDTFSIATTFTFGVYGGIWYTCDAVGGPTTVSMAAGPRSNLVVAIEVSGNPTTSCLDQVGQSAGSGNFLSAITAGSVSQSNELAVSAFQADSGACTLLTTDSSNTEVAQQLSTSSASGNWPLMATIGNANSGLSGQQRSSATCNASIANSGSAIATFRLNTSGAVAVPVFRKLVSTDLPIKPKCFYSSSSPATCGAAQGGTIQMAATTTTFVINTTSVTPTSTFAFSWTTVPSGCTTAPTNIASMLPPYVTSITLGTSFTITLPVAPVVNAACLDFTIF